MLTRISDYQWVDLSKVVAANGWCEGGDKYPHPVVVLFFSGGHQERIELAETESRRSEDSKSEAYEWIEKVLENGKAP